MPLGFGNAVVLQTMFSKYLYSPDTGTIKFIHLISHSCLGVASARVSNGSGNWFCSVIEGFRLVFGRQ